MNCGAFPTRAFPTRALPCTQVRLGSVVKAYGETNKLAVKWVAGKGRWVAGKVGMVVPTRIKTGVKKAAVSVAAKVAARRDA